MEKPNRVRLMYGYVVCLVAVVTSLICINGAVSNAIDLNNPVAAAGGYGEALGSFDAWMASRQNYASPRDGTASDTTSEATLRRRFDAMRESRIAQTTFRARKGLTTQLLVLIVAIVLFTTHWRWMRQFRDE